jgi:hypothetical protein
MDLRSRTTKDLFFSFCLTVLKRSAEPAHTAHVHLSGTWSSFRPVGNSIVTDVTLIGNFKQLIDKKSYLELKGKTISSCTGRKHMRDQHTEI